MKLHGQLALIGAVMLATIAGVVSCGSENSRNSTEVLIGIGNLRWLDPVPEDAAYLSSEESSGGVHCFSVNMGQDLLPNFVEVDRIRGCAKDGRIISMAIRLRSMSAETVEELEKWMQSRWGSGKGGMIVRQRTPNDGIEIRSYSSLKWETMTGKQAVVTRKLFIDLCSPEVPGGEIAAGAPAYCGVLRLAYEEGDRR